MTRKSSEVYLTQHVSTSWSSTKMRMNGQIALIIIFYPNKVITIFNRSRNHVLTHSDSTNVWNVLQKKLINMYLITENALPTDITFAHAHLIAQTMSITVWYLAPVRHKVAIRAFVTFMTYTMSTREYTISTAQHRTRVCISSHIGGKIARFVI